MKGRPMSKDVYQELVINGNIKMNKYGTKERTTLF